MEARGAAAGSYRGTVYRQGFSGKEPVPVGRILELAALAGEVLRDTIGRARREDGLFHAYNVLAPRGPGGGHGIQHLHEMLEGQVAALSTRAVDDATACEVLDAIRASRLYRADQESYLLYPDRRLPGFLEKNGIPEEALERAPLLARLFAAGEDRVVHRDASDARCDRRRPPRRRRLQGGRSLPEPVPGVRRRLRRHPGRRAPLRRLRTPVPGGRLAGPRARRIQERSGTRPNSVMVGGRRAGEDLGSEAAMKRLQNVWVHVDALAPAAGAVAAAVEVSRRSGAVLTILGAIGRPEKRLLETSFGDKILQLVRRDQESRLLALEADARCSLAPDRVRSVILEGEVPWHSVAAHAVAHSPELLAVAARGGTPGGFDPVTQHLFRKCPAPVWAVYPGRISFPRRALAAVSPGLAGSHERLLARRVLELALRIAGGHPLELHVATAWSVPGEELLRTSTEVSTQAYADGLRENARRDMEELLAEAELSSGVEVHLPKGDPESAMPALAEKVDADLVLLGSAGRTGLAGYFIGSSAEGIIARLARSVLVVKPPGFVSPVRPSRSERATTLTKLA